MSTTNLRRARELIQQAERILVLTGAGVSAESGIRTFRDAQSGLWADFDPMKLASQEGFAEDPGLVWRWYMARFQQLREVQPNPAHEALARLQKQKIQTTLITQNVDDLHERAGSTNVLHLHGSIARFHCNECRLAHDLAQEEIEAEQPPRCHVCTGYVRPSVVWFGEVLPQVEVEQAWQAVRSCELMLVVGTSGVVYPVAELPWLARHAGAKVIDINPEPTPISEMADVFLQGKAGELLPQLVMGNG